MDIDVPTSRIREFCDKWKIVEFSLFGSVLRDDFKPDSDIDVLVELEPNHGHSLFELVDMKDELEQMFGRPVDLVLKGGLRNPIRRRIILDSRRVLYAA
jgi:predicted nucleotidyltransferase